MCDSYFENDNTVSSLDVTGTISSSKDLFFSDEVLSYSVIRFESFKDYKVSFNNMIIDQMCWNHMR